MKIENGVFVVTGGGSGLGAATAHMLAAEGGRVVLADVNRDAGEQVARELGNAAVFVPTDVADETSAKAAIDRAVTGFGGLNGLVNCAGVAPAEKVIGREAPHRLDSFMRTVNINLIGTFNMLRLAADAMVKLAPREGGERGVIVNTASVAAYDGQIGQAGYAASKAGIVSRMIWCHASGAGGCCQGAGSE